MIDFPANPIVGQSFQVGNTIYKCVSINPAVWSATSSQSGIPEAPAGGKTYGRKDADWSELTKNSVGLDQVNNTSDLNKPISTATQGALNAKEPTIAASTTANYWRGDKTWQALTKSAVGLPNVDNTADAVKTVSSATYLRSGANPAGSLIPFSWADDGTQPAYIWGGNNVEGRVYYRTNLKVGACGTADNANAVNGISGWNYSNRAKNPVYMWCTDGSGQDQYLTQPGNISVNYANRSDRVNSVEGAGGGTIGSAIQLNGWLNVNGEFDAQASIKCRQGIYGGLGVNKYNWFWDGARIYCFVDNTNCGFANLTSDERQKEDIQPLESNTDDFMQLKPITFRWKLNANVVTSNEKRVDGLSAQNVKRSFPQSTFGDFYTPPDETGNLKFPGGVDDRGVIAHIIVQVQKLIRENAALKGRIAALEAR